VRLNLLGPSYEDAATQFSAQRSINCYLQPSEIPGTRSEVVVRACYGIAALATPDIAGSVRGLKTHKGDGRLYAVIGSSFCYIDSAGAHTVLGTLDTTTGRVIFADGGQTSTDNQLLILDGTSSYVWDQATTTFTKLSTAVLPSAITGTYLDGYYIVNQAENSDTFEISALNDATSWVAEQTREASEADPIVRVIANHGELWVFGSYTAKIWTNTGNIDFPFENLEGSLIDRGLASKYALVADDNTLFWLGNDRIVYRANGYTPQRVSNFPIEQKLFACSETCIANAWMGSHTEDGAKMITLKVPDVDRCWQYNIATGLWHERQTFNTTNWSWDHIETAYGKVVLGSSTNSTIGYLDSRTFTELGNTMQFTRISGPISADQAPYIIDRLEIVTEAGVSELSGEGADAEIMLFISKDGGKTWGNPLVKNLGARGDFTHRAVWRQLGQHYNSNFRIVITDPVRRTLMSAVAEVEPLSI
jgi:hypothetical protein